MAAGCTLGCGEYTVFATDRCGGRIACSLTDRVNSLKFGRVMDDTSEAEIVLDVAAGGGESCCACVGDLRSWRNSVAIYRDGELVWGPGPITNILYKSEQVVLKARDVSAWLDVRTLHDDYAEVDVEITALARRFVKDAMLPDDPCNIGGLVSATDNRKKPLLISKDVLANTVYAGDALRDLARIGLDYTVVGASIVLATPLQFGPFGLLRDEHFQTEIEVEERGIETATKWYVPGGTPGLVGEAGGVDEWFGLIEQVAQEDNVIDQAAADAAAENRLEASNPPPVYVNIPDGARLSPNAPVCFDQLVPGSLFEVNLQDLCRPVHLLARLTAVTVTSTGSGDEQVGVTLAPLGTNLNDASAVVR